MRQLQVVARDGVENGDAALLSADEDGRGGDPVRHAADLSILLVQNSIVTPPAEPS